MAAPDQKQSSGESRDVAGDTKTDAVAQGLGQPAESPDWVPGDIAPHWYSPNPYIEWSKEEIAEIKAMVDLIGNKDIAARRWEVEQTWEAQLFDRGYQYLLPRKGGGWTLPPFATDYNRRGGTGKKKYAGFPVNIYTTYGEIISAALTRDIPGVQFLPRDPLNNACVTAADAGTKYARVFKRNNDLMGLHHQLVYYLRNDGRAVIVTDHTVDAQRFGRDIPEQQGAVPETETELATPLGFVARHGETPMNEAGLERGRAQGEEAELDMKGTQSVDKAVEFLRDKGVTRIIASPVERAAQSSELAGQALGVPVEIDDRLASLDVGEFEGQPKEQVHDQIAQYAKNPDEQLPGGESFSQLDQRVQDAAFDALRMRQPGPESGEGSGPFLFVTHNSVVSSLNRLINGFDDGGSDFIPPGGIAAIYDAPGGGYAMRLVFPPQQQPDQEPLKRGKPRGQETVNVYGKLEAKVPINTACQDDMPYIQVCFELDIADVQARFPSIKEEIKPGGAGAGENELDRIARINAALGLEASYVTGDSMVRDCTVQRSFLRPAWFMTCKNEEIQKKFFTSCPDGMEVVYAGEAFCYARNEGLNDHCTVVQAFPGKGQNRIALMSKIIPLAKRLNNWCDLLNAFFVRCVPWKWYDNEAFDIEAIKEQSNTPGQSGPFQARVGLSFEQLMGVEQTPTHQPSFPEFINLFATDFPQLLSGALPTLFGAEANTDTVGATMIQRDQALGRLATPWHNITYATVSYFWQAVRHAAKCRKRGIHEAVGSEVIDIELSDLKGDVLCYPEEDVEIPESQMQRRAQYEKMLVDATNPIMAAFLQLKRNLRVARDAIGISDFIIPGANAYDKQLGELKILLRSGPVDNPEKVYWGEQLANAIAGAAKDSVNGTYVDPKQGQLFQAAQEKIDAMPDLVSTVEIDVATDNHEAEAECLLDWMNDPEGRRFRNGTSRQRAAFLNVKTHYQEHNREDEKRKQKNMMMNSLANSKSPTISSNTKDMPPDLAIQAWERSGLQPSPDDMQLTKVKQVSEVAKDLPGNQATKKPPEGVTVQ